MKPTKAARAAAYYRRRAAVETAHGRSASTLLDRAVNIEATLYAAHRCHDCGRELSDPVSVARGIGGDCFAARMGRR